MAKPQPIQAPKGFRDILPQEFPYWEKIRKVVSDIAGGYSFYFLNTPIVESEALFRSTVGEHTDIVSKQMFELKMRGGGERLVLRPEGTAGVARAFVEHGMHTLPQPVKLWYWGPMFRYESPQRGRFRELWQFGFEALGEADSVADAEIILVAYKILGELGIKNVVVHLNSIGCSTCRPRFREALRAYYRPKINMLCVNCRERIKKNSLRLLDCKEERCQPFKAQAPQSVDYLCEPCHHHFRELLETLDEIELPYVLNPRLVRGLDYYTRTVFEIFREEDVAQGWALAAGGRYDLLVELLRGRPMPAVGVAGGIDRIALILQESKKQTPASRPPDLFLVQLGVMAKRRALKIFEDLRESGFHVASTLGRDSLRTQLRSADRLGALIALIYGQKEALEGTIILRQMKTGAQETVSVADLVTELKKRLRRE